MKSKQPAIPIEELEKRIADARRIIDEQGSTADTVGTLMTTLIQVSKVLEKSNPQACIALNQEVQALFGEYQQLRYGKSTASEPTGTPPG